MWSANDFYYCLIKFTAIKMHSHSHNKILLNKNIQRHSHVNTHCCTIYRKMPTHKKYTMWWWTINDIGTLFFLEFLFLNLKQKKNTQRTCELVSGLIELSTTMAGNSVWKFIAISIIKRMAIKTMYACGKMQWNWAAFHCVFICFHFHIFGIMYWFVFSFLSV